MRWLVVGPYPPELGSGAAAAAAFVAERLEAGDTVHAVSPRPTAAHVHLPLEGLPGVRALWRAHRHQAADGLWLRVESGIVLRHGVDRRQALAERMALVVLLRRFRTSILDVGDVALLPGGRAGRPVLRSASRFVVRSARDGERLVADGAPADRVTTVASAPPPHAGASAPTMPPAVVDYPEPIGLRDLAGTKESIERAVRQRAEALEAARRAAATDGP